MHFKRIIAGLTLSLATLLAQAVPITDTVIVGDKEWAQVNLFAELSWNDINAVCPAGVCGTGTLNGYDMSGWAWASVFDVGALFNQLTPHPGAIAFFAQGNSLWAPAFFDVVGFDPTPHAVVVTARYVQGWTNSLNGISGEAYFSFLFDDLRRGETDFAVTSGASTDLGNFCKSHRSDPASSDTA